MAENTQIDILMDPRYPSAVQTNVQNTRVGCVTRDRFVCMIDDNENKHMLSDEGMKEETVFGSENDPQPLAVDLAINETGLGRSSDTAADVSEDSEDEEDEQEHSSAVAISCLENLILSFLSQLARAISLPSNTDDGKQSVTGIKKVVLELAARHKAATDDEYSPTRCVQFPRNSESAGAVHVRQLAHILRIVDITHEALVNDVPITKRDMYYRDMPLFQKQSVVDNLVDDLAATFNMSRADLNIRAALKGVFCGSGLRIYLKSGTVTIGKDSEPTLIPLGEEIDYFELDDDVLWILMVEKEAVFQTLCSLGFVNHPLLRGRGIIITGKGYPDRATRQLVKTLADNIPASIPILALVDADAYGLDIVSVYKNGSRSMKHENQTLAADRVQWIGVKTSELERKELMHMLHNRRKAEIEILSSLPSQSLTLYGLATLEMESETLDEESTSPERPINALLRYLVIKINQPLRSLSDQFTLLDWSR